VETLEKNLHRQTRNPQPFFPFKQAIGPRMEAAGTFFFVPRVIFRKNGTYLIFLTGNSIGKKGCAKISANGPDHILLII
jgi:hypothetical protein